MKAKMGSLGYQLQKAKQSGFQPRRGSSQTKSPSDYTKCHTRRLRQQHCEKCSESLAWLEADGYTATELTIKNDQTGDSELIHRN